MKTKLLILTASVLAGLSSQGHIFLGQAGFGGNGVPTVAGAGPWTFTYDVELDGATIQAGSYFTLFDFPGVTAADVSHTLGADWTVTVTPAPPAAFGPVVNGPGDDIYALYTGAGLTDPSGFPPLLLGTLTVATSLSGSYFYPGPNFNSIVAEKPPGVFFSADNTLNIAVPVPEGSTIASMVGLGLLGAGYVVRRRLQKA